MSTRGQCHSLTFDPELCHFDIQVSWPTWPPCPYMFKTFKNLFHQNQLTDGLRVIYPRVLWLNGFRWATGPLLAHLSRWAYSIGRPPSSVVRRRPSSSSTLFKHLLLRNHWANWSQISYGAFTGWGNESLYIWSRSHDQDGRHAHIW